jgi:hypothetical protein
MNPVFGLYVIQPDGFREAAPAGIHPTLEEARKNVRKVKKARGGKVPFHWVITDHNRLVHARSRGSQMNDHGWHGVWPNP